MFDHRKFDWRQPKSSLDVLFKNKTTELIGEISQQIRVLEPHQD